MNSIIPSFMTGNGSKDSTPGTVEQRRKLANALMLAGSSVEPVQSPWQAAARVAQGLVGGLSTNAANKAEERGIAGANEKLAAALAGGDIGAAMSDPWYDSNANALLGLAYKQQNPELAQNDIKYGFTPQWYKINGQLKFGVLGDNGSFKEIQAPDGAEWAPGVQMNNTGTAFVPTNKRTGEVEGSAIPIDNAGAAAAKAEGTATGVARSEFGPAVETARNTVMRINDLLANPNLGSATGVESYLPDAAVAAWTGGKSTRVKTEILNLQGNAFLEGRQLLKGGGQITDFEGRKADQAFSLMETAQNDEDFIRALTMFRDALQSGVDKLAMKAKVPTQDVTPTEPSVDELLQKYGGQ